MAVRLGHGARGCRRFRRRRARGDGGVGPRGGRGRAPHASAVERRGLSAGALPTLAAVSAIPYAIRRSDRARRVRVTVDADKGVEVVLPRRAPKRAAARAVAELEPWI